MDEHAVQAIPLGAAGSGAQAGAYLRLQDGISALKENVRKDHVLHIRLFHLTWKSVRTRPSTALGNPCFPVHAEHALLLACLVSGGSTDTRWTLREKDVARIVQTLQASRDQLCAAQGHALVW